jgi:uncharacterized membrane protein YfhO
MTFEVFSPVPALFYVAESYYPGWHASVNGRPEAVVRANWLAMAVPVPAGTSTVELQYVTPGYCVGLLVTLISLSLFAVAWVLGPRLVTRGKS